MCLIIFDWQPNNARLLTLASNRDEFYQRPTLDAHYWKEFPHIFGGRDLKMNGSWLAISKHGRLAAVTNYRAPDSKEYARSRGEIPTDFLNSSEPAINFSKSLPKSEYAGFNALLFDGEQLVYCNNRDEESDNKILAPGKYGLSNHLLNTPWPKVRKTKPALDLVDQEKNIEYTAQILLDTLGNSERAASEELPVTGIAPEIEHMLSPAFITSPNYGTRTSSVVIIEKNDDLERLKANFWERLYEQGKKKYEDKYYQLELQID